MHLEPKAKKSKRPLSSFMHFSAAKRPETTAAYPCLKPSDINKKLGEMWRAASDEDKSPFVKLAADAKLAFDKGKNSFAKGEPSNADAKQKQKRPANSFMLFTKAKTAEIKAANPDLSFAERGKQIGELWRAASEKEKQVFEFVCNIFFL